MQVILDGVFNHASSDGMYFDRYDRYGGTAPTPARACRSGRSGGRGSTSPTATCPARRDYIGWFGLDSLPTFNHGVDAVKDFFYRGPTT